MIQRFQLKISIDITNSMASKFSSLQSQTLNSKESFRSPDKHSTQVIYYRNLPTGFFLTALR